MYIKHATPFQSVKAIGIASAPLGQVVCSGDNEMVTMTRSCKNWTVETGCERKTLKGHG